MGIRYFSVLIKLMTGKLVTDPTSGMRMVNRQVMEIYAQNYPKDYPEPGECDGDPQNGQKSHGASGSHERKGRGQLFYRRI